MDCSLPGFPVHGILQARILEWVAVSFSRGSSQSRDGTRVSCIVGGCFTLWAMERQSIMNIKYNRLHNFQSQIVFVSKPFTWKGIFPHLLIWTGLWLPLMTRVWKNGGYVLLYSFTLSPLWSPNWPAWNQDTHGGEMGHPVKTILDQPALSMPSSWPQMLK